MVGLLLWLVLGGGLVRLSLLGWGLWGLAVGGRTLLGTLRLPLLALGLGFLCGFGIGGEDQNFRAVVQGHTGLSRFLGRGWGCLGGLLALRGFLGLGGLFWGFLGGRRALAGLVACRRGCSGRLAGGCLVGGGRRLRSGLGVLLLGRWGFGGRGLSRGRLRGLGNGCGSGLGGRWFWRSRGG